MPCFEIVDSRIENWQIAIQDTIADNASCGVYVLGNTEIDPNETDLPSIKIDVSKNGTSGEDTSVDADVIEVGEAAIAATDVGVAVVAFA